MHVIRKIVTIILWKTADDPTIACTKLDLIAIPVLLIPEFGWYIYGNMLVWNGDIMNACITSDPYFYWSVVVLLAYGYIFMTVFLLILCSAIAICCYFRIHGGKPTKEEDSPKSKLNAAVEANALRIQEAGFLSEITKF